MEQLTLKSRIRELYSIIRTAEGTSLMDSLLHDEQYTLLMAYDSQKAWIERVKYLFLEIVKAVMNRKHEQIEGIEENTPVGYFSAS